MTTQGFHPTRLWPGLLLATALVAACSPSDSGGKTVRFADTNLELDFSQTKIFNFSWAAVEGVDHYRLVEEIKKGLGFHTLANTIAATDTSYQLEVPLYARTEARYQLLGCNAKNQCDAVAETQVDDVAKLVKAVGYFKASDAVSDDPNETNLGGSMAISDDGDTLVVFAYKSVTNPNDATGVVYIFRRTGAGQWVEEQQLNADGTPEGAYFGESLSLSADGKRLAIGANGDDKGDGAVYLFERDGSKEMGYRWQQVMKLTNPKTSGYFGIKVSLSADGNLMVACSSVPLLNTADKETLYLYNKAQDWNPNKAIEIEAPQADEDFCASVSVNKTGTLIAVGASDAAVTPEGQATVEQAGKVYLYSRASTEESFDIDNPATLHAENPGMNDRYGERLSLSQDGTTLAVGARDEDTQATEIVHSADSIPDNEASAGSGAVYLYQLNSDNNWTFQAYLKADNADAGDAFGDALSLSADGNQLVVGANSEDSSATGINGDGTDNSIRFAGAAYTFSRANGRWHQQSYIKASNTRGDSYPYFGVGLSLSGDGRTLAIGAPGESNDAKGINQNQDNGVLFGSGAVYVY